ncbi:hypothetical protein [Rhizobium leguminosarum]|uniref:hypothetical protein n=1 Tax=Rhizobium leguminosarum TaxID=384 RepID=UPI0013AF0F8D|nr:hypothetical protein [Rhizobium leguminosarum]
MSKRFFALAANARWMHEAMADHFKTVGEAPGANRAASEINQLPASQSAITAQLSRKIDELPELSHPLC